MPECLNCESHVSEAYARVFTPDGYDRPRVCPNCEDVVRDGAEIREARSHRDRTQEPTTFDPDKARSDGGPMTDGGHDQWWCKECGHATDQTPWDVEDCPECGACSWANRRYMVDTAAEPPATPDGGRIESPAAIFDDEADEQVATAMRDQLGDARFVYIKTGDIADATDYSNREVGQRLRRVASKLGLELAEWGQGHSSTTWHLSRGDGA